MDDPYVYGQIAAANSLSDVYAMGGVPIIALNIVCFPSCLEPDVLAEILRGGADKVKEAGASLVGGHSVEDDEPKYGLCVTGTIHPDKVLTNRGAQPGDRLILTKPLGSGVMSTAIKAEMLTTEEYDETIRIMSLLNKSGLEAAGAGKVHACTDITGFGLLGHTVEMAEGSGVTLSLRSKDIPLIGGARSYAGMGLIPAGMYRNRSYFSPRINMMDSSDEALMDLMYDPQTSGGLLLSVAPEDAGKVLERLSRIHPCAFAEIGFVKAAGDAPVEVI